MTLNESIVEDAALTWFGELGYAVGHGPQMAPGESVSRAGGKDSFGEVVLVGRLREALQQLNSAIPDEALRRVLRARQCRRWCRQTTAFTACYLGFLRSRPQVLTALPSMIAIESIADLEDIMT